MSESLLPCPFCGSDDVHPQYDAKMVQFGYGSCVGCLQCGATILTMHGYDESRQRWNRRASLTLAPAAGETGKGGAE